MPPGAPHHRQKRKNVALLLVLLAVMALFYAAGVGHRVEGIVSTTGLPEAAVRKFLGRSVKAGLLALSSDGYYTRPAKERPEAAQ